MNKAALNSIREICKICVQKSHADFADYADLNLITL